MSGSVLDYARGKRAGKARVLAGCGGFCAGPTEYVRGYLDGCREGWTKRIAQERAEGRGPTAEAERDRRAKYPDLYPLG